MKVLVTGAAGFIGGQLWHKLWQRGDEVVGIDNFSYGNLDNLKFDDHDFCLLYTSPSPRDTR